MLLTKKELLEHPNYLLTTYQLEIYRLLANYKETHNLTQQEIADKLGVSNSYVSQILNGNFNFTLKKLIELGLLIGKIPTINFLDIDEYWLTVDGNSKIYSISIRPENDKATCKISTSKVFKLGKKKTKQLDSGEIVECDMFDDCLSIS